MESASCLTNQVQMKKYQLIKGVVSDLQISHGYEDLVFTDSIKNTAGTAASAAALIGQVFNAGTLATASGGAEISMQFFTCKLDEKRVVGRFYNVGFKDGEEIEFVVEQEGDIYAVLAARSASQRLIWMLPQHLRGEEAHLRSDIIWSIITTIIGAILYAIFLHPSGIKDDLLEPMWSKVFNWCMPFILGLVFNVIIRSFFNRFGKATTPILAALGFESPENIDLPAISRAARKRYKQEHGVSADSDPTWVWRYCNPLSLVDFPDKFQDNIYDLDRMNLTQAQLPFSPWSDSYWPSYQGSIAQRYADPRMPKSSQFKDYDNYLTKINPAINLVKNNQINLMSPSEKYDFLMNDPNFTLTNKILENTRSRNKNPESWEGLCHGWAPASYMYQRPSRSITLYNAAGKAVTFRPSDIKALNTLLWARLSYKTKFIGGRCNIQNPKTDEIGRILDKDCNDNNPGSFHLALINQIGINKRSLVFDATYDYQVWNQPITAYNLTYYNPETGSISKRAQDVMIAKEKYSKDKFKKYRSREGDSVVGVKLTVDYVLETKPSTKESDSPANDSVTQVTYYYDLELNSKTGKVVGGEWHQKGHPDFLWTPSAGSEISSNIVPKTNSHFGPLFMYHHYWWIDSPRSTVTDWLPYSISAAKQMTVPLENIVRALTAWSSNPIEDGILPEAAQQPNIPEKYKWARQ